MLTHSAREYFEKLAFLKKTRNFKRLYLRVETKISRKFIQVSSKQGCFLHALPTWVHDRGLRPLQLPAPLPASRRAERDNDEPVKVLNLLFFVYLIWKWEENLEKLRFFTSGPKQCFYLTHSTREYFEKLAFKKK